MAPIGSGLKQVMVSPGQLLLFSAFFFIPTLSPALFGWLNGMAAIPVFYLLTVNGLKPGTRLLQASLLAAALGALLMHRMEVFLFSLTLIPLGYCLFHGAEQGDSAAVSGGKGVVVLALSWLVFWGILAAVTGTNPYRSLLAILDQGFVQSQEFYASKEAGLSPETVYTLQQVTKEVRETVPKLLPGLLAAVLVLTVWLNMLISNSLAARLPGGSFPWGKYANWQLPEQLVWIPIAAITLLLVGSGPIQYVGSWALLLSGLLYFFQGLAVCLALMERWNVPTYVRAILYFVLILQSYGLILLAFLGVGEVWFNFRQKIKQP